MTASTLARRWLLLFTPVLLASCGSSGDSTADGDDPGSTAEELVRLLDSGGVSADTVLPARGREVKVSLQRIDTVTVRRPW